MLEYQGIFTRLLKYLLEGIAVAVAAALVSRRIGMNFYEIATIAAVAAVTFFLLDTLAPSVAVGARTGSGFGVGYNMVGGGVGEGCGFVREQGTSQQFGGNYASEGVGFFKGGVTPLGVTPLGVTPLGATTVDATSDAKALPSTYVYGANAQTIPVTTVAGEVVSPSSTVTTVSPATVQGPGVVASSGCVISQGACANGSPLFTQPINDCGCTLDCKPQCYPELQCPVSCPLGQRVFPDCNIASNNSPYKIVPGMFSHQIILPGYNECVKPYNYYENDLGYSA
jgi:hypothetical protein